MTYTSDTYDSRGWKSIAWWLQCDGSMPGVSGPPVTAYLGKPPEDEERPGCFRAPVPGAGLLIPGGQQVSGCQTAQGEVDDPGSLLRACIEIQQWEISTVAFRIVARRR
jgi:hypothetical protein